LFQTGQNGQPAEAFIQELSQQLHNWRTHLPPAIAWNDNDSIEATVYSPQAGADPRTRNVVDFKITLNAALRTRYKYAEYLIWRPYIFRALHYPHALLEYDYECCSKAFKVSL